MKFTVFCIVGRKGVTRDELMTISRNTRLPHDKWLNLEAFKTVDTVCERDYYKKLKDITFDVGKGYIDRILVLRGLEAKDNEDAALTARGFILTEADQEVFCEGYQSFEEIVDPLLDERQILIGRVDRWLREKRAKGEL